MQRKGSPATGKDDSEMENSALSKRGIERQKIRQTDKFLRGPEGKLRFRRLMEGQKGEQKK